MDLDDIIVAQLHDTNCVHLMLGPFFICGQECEGDRACDECWQPEQSSRVSNQYPLKVDFDITMGEGLQCCSL